MRILIVSPRKDDWSELADTLKQGAKVELSWVASGAEALQAIQDVLFDLVVTDEILEDMTGLELVRLLVKTSPMITCAVGSSLSSEEFHEASEGLGVLAQLPLHPGARQAHELLQRLAMILPPSSGTQTHRPS